MAFNAAVVVAPLPERHAPFLRIGRLFAMYRVRIRHPLGESEEVLLLGRPKQARPNMVGLGYPMPMPFLLVVVGLSTCTRAQHRLTDFTPTIAPQNSCLFSASEEKRRDFDIH